MAKISLKSVSPTIYLSVTKAIAGLQIRALLQLLGCLYNLSISFISPAPKITLNSVDSQHP